MGHWYRGGHSQLQPTLDFSLYRHQDAASHTEMCEKSVLIRAPQPAMLPLCVWVPGHLPVRHGRWVLTAQVYPDVVTTGGVWACCMTLACVHLPAAQLPSL